MPATEPTDRQVRADIYKITTFRFGPDVMMAGRRAPLGQNRAAGAIP